MLGGRLWASTSAAVVEEGEKGEKEEEQIRRNKRSGECKYITSESCLIYIESLTLLHFSYSAGDRRKIRIRSGKRAKRKKDKEEEDEEKEEDGEKRGRSSKQVKVNNKSYQDKNAALEKERTKMRRKGEYKEKN